MATIQNVTIPDDKRVVISLTYLYGIGETTSKKILIAANIDENIRVKDLSEDQLSKIRNEIDKMKIKIEGELRSEKLANIERLKYIGCYRGIRHRNNLRLRGQSTKRNARTGKGSRQIVANKKK